MKIHKVSGPKSDGSITDSTENTATAPAAVGCVLKCTLATGSTPPGLHPAGTAG